MQISLILDPARLWHWHEALIAVLTARPGARVAVSFAKESVPLPQTLHLALQVEALVSRGDAAQPFARRSPPDFARWTSTASARPDLTIDLATDTKEARAPGRTLIPFYDGAAGEEAFWLALLDGRAPALLLYDSAAGALLAAGQPAVENTILLRQSAANVIARVMQGLVTAACAPRSPALAATAAFGATPVAPVSPLRARGITGGCGTFLTRKVARNAANALDRLLGTAPRWSTAWRLRPARFDPFASGPLPFTGFNRLADDGKRYYADPFLFARGGQVDLFVEEFPVATGRGIISHVAIGPDGAFGTPRPVLETGTHLSYPHVFSRDGAIWMLPEASASEGLTLYRAVDYPRSWEPVARLIDEPLNDATLFEHGGVLWIAAAGRGSLGAPTQPWGSSWDSLYLYSADRLTGPWQPHPANPVLIDAAWARPAGAVFEAAGRLFRPVQDCTRGYGYGLGLAEITRLDRTGYAQTAAGVMAFEAGSGLLGPHTLNRLATAAGTYEAVDVFARGQALANAGRGAQRRL